MRTVELGSGAVEDIRVSFAATGLVAGQIQLALGTAVAPVAIGGITWVNPQTLTLDGLNASATLRVGGTLYPARGVYWVWYRAVRSGGDTAIRLVDGEPFAVVTVGGLAPSGLAITNVPTVVGQVLTITSLSPLTAAWSTPVAGSGGGSSPDLTYGGGVYGAGVYSPAA